jgi:hypothetical protein
MMNNLVLSILAVAQVGGIALPKPNVRSAISPVVKAVGFETHGGHGTVGGQEADGWIELSGPAPCETLCGTYINGKPSGGMTVQMTSSNTAAVKVQSVRVPTGETRTTLAVLTSGVSAATPVTISAWREGSAVQKTILNVTPTSLNGIKIDQSSVISGAPADCNVMFTGTPGPAGGVKATMTSSNPAAVQVPASVPLDAGKTFAAFDVKTAGVHTSTPVTIIASYSDVKVTSSLTVTPGVLVKFNGSPELNGVAPPSGAVIHLTSADPAHASVPATVTIPAGATKTTVAIITDHPDWSPHHVTISATYLGVTKTYDEIVWKNIKPDLAIKEVKLKDRGGAPITHPQDAQPYKVCVTIETLGRNGPVNYLYPSATTIGISVLSPNGTGASGGHESVVPVTLTAGGNPALHGGFSTADDYSTSWYDPVCIDVPGLPQPGSYADITLKVDSKNTIDETNEGNNAKKLRVTRQ